MICLPPGMGSRIVEKGKRNPLVKRVHSLYRMFSCVSDPIFQALTRWEQQRGTPPVSSVLEQHYYWAIRYHFFLGYRQYLQSPSQKQAASAEFRVGRQRVPD